MIAYLDVPSGLSGDMFLACLVAAGWPVERLRAVVASLGLPTDEWSLEVGTVRRAGFAATQVRVKAATGRHRRHLSDIRRLMSASALPEAIKSRATAVFARLATAEAKVHSCDMEQVHLHEVGAVDAIIDVVGCVAGLHELGVTQVFCSGLPLGKGWTDSHHGRIPLPAPATLELLAAVGAPTQPAPGPGEWVTPTAAALLAEVAIFKQPAMMLRRVGVGAGERDPVWPNIARLWLGDDVAEPVRVVQIETNIDDMNPQLYPAVIDALLSAGALDVWLTPIQMKKGRPGTLLGAIAPADREAALAEIILRQTTTLGVRVHGVHRHEAAREAAQVATPYGTIDIKVKLVDGQVMGATPEYECCRRLAQKWGVAVQEVYRAALAAASGRLGVHADHAPSQSFAEGRRQGGCHGS